MRITSRLCIAIVCCLLFALRAFSQSSIPGLVATSPQDGTKKRPTIGVALEGGGALGLAHIGVLQWFEDHHIPVDYVAGTSMGGLVGGLYATGKSPQQLKQIVAEQSWDTIIGGEPDYRDLSFRRKEDARAFPNRLEVGFKKGLSLPSGLNSGQLVSMLIDRETLPYSHSGSFNDLPIPFRCVATNLVTGDAVVFDHGSIAQAMRATMSIPGVFAPVRDGDNIYVDGGLLGNLPTDVVRKMGADIVIAVHLNIAPADPAAIQSLFSVLGRSVEVVIHQNELRGLAGADLIVNVDLQQYNGMQYDQAKAIINLGTEAAAAKSNVLSPYALDDASWNSYVQARQERIQTKLPVPQSVEVRGTRQQTIQALEHFLKPLAGQPIDPPKLEERLNRLTGIGRFDSVDYWLEDKNDQAALIVFVHEKSYGPPTLNLGFEVDGSESKNVTFTQAGRLTFIDFAGYRSEWRTDFAFGNTYGISSELYRPFTALSRWFFAPRAQASNQGVSLFFKNDPVALYRIESADIGLDLGYGFNRFSEARVGYQFGYSSANLNLGRPDFTSFSGEVSDFRVRLGTDHRDDPIVPRRGYDAGAAFDWYLKYPGTDRALPAGVASLGVFVPVSKKGSIFGSAEGGTSFGIHDTGIPLFFLGAPLRLSAYGSRELFGEQYYLFGAGYLHELLSLPPFVGKKVYAVGTYELGKMYRNPSEFSLTPESRYPMDGAAGVITETALGPLFIGGSVGDSGHQKWFFQLGRVF
jgi:NTE family protein